MSLSNHPRDLPYVNKSLGLSSSFRDLVFLFEELKQLIIQQEGWAKYCKVIGELTTEEFKLGRDEGALWKSLRRLIDHLIAGYKFKTTTKSDVDLQNPPPPDDEGDMISSLTNCRALEGALRETEQKFRQQVKKIYELEADLATTREMLEKAEKTLEEKSQESGSGRFHHRLKETNGFGFRPNSPPQGSPNDTLTLKDVSFLKRIEELLNSSDLEMHHKLSALREEVQKYKSLKNCYSPTAKETPLMSNGNTAKVLSNLPAQMFQKYCAPKTEREPSSNGHHHPLLNQNNSPGQLKLGCHVPKSKSLRYGLIKLPDCIKMIVKSGCEKISRNASIASVNENKFRTVLNSVAESNNHNNHRPLYQGLAPGKTLAGQHSPGLTKSNGYLNPQVILQHALLQGTSGMKDYVLLNNTQKQDGEPFGFFPE